MGLGIKIPTLDIILFCLGILDGVGDPNEKCIVVNCQYPNMLSFSWALCVIFLM